MSEHLMLLHRDGIESFSGERDRSVRARELHRGGQVTAQWVEPCCEVTVRLAGDGLALFDWDGRGDVRALVRDRYPAATALMFPDAEGDYVDVWIAVTA